MPDNLELEADASQPEENSEPPVLDIDDADDCSTSDDYIEKQKLDLPQEIIVKIREQTKTKLDSSTILPSYHFKSNMLARVRKTRFGVSGGGYSVISKPVLTEKRGVDHFDWTFFTG